MEDSPEMHPDIGVLMEAEQTIRKVLALGYKEPFDVPIETWLRIPNEPHVAKGLADIFEAWAKMGRYDPGFLHRVGWEQAVALARYIMTGFTENKES